MPDDDRQLEPRAPEMRWLPRVEDLPAAAEGYDSAAVVEAFAAFRREVADLQAQLRALQGLKRLLEAEPGARAVRLESLQLVRSAADFAEALELDAHEAATLRRAEAEAHMRETERRRVEILRTAGRHAREILADARAEAAEIREAGRAEVEQAFDWARARAAEILEHAERSAPGAVAHRAATEAGPPPRLLDAATP